MSGSPTVQPRGGGQSVLAFNTSPSSPNPDFGRTVPDEVVLRTAQALELHGIRTLVVDDSSEARSAVLQLIPRGAEVFDATSRTLTDTGIAEALAKPGEYRHLRPQVYALAKEGKRTEQRRLGSTPEYVVGSVHAITEDGQVVIASATGSQLAAYVYGAGKVVWVVGSQKIVPDLPTALRRIREYTFPLEDERARHAYGAGSVIAKTLIVSREVVPDRITVVLVKQRLGF